MDTYKGIEKTVNINGEAVRLLANFQNAMIFRNNFGKDFIKTFYAITRRAQNNEECPLGEEELTQFTWTLAKTYNRDLEPYDEWVAGLIEFPVMEIMPVVLGLLTSNFSSNSDISSSSKKEEGAER